MVISHHARRPVATAVEIDSDAEDRPSCDARSSHSWHEPADPAGRLRRHAHVRAAVRQRHVRGVVPAGLAGRQRARTAGPGTPSSPRTGAPSWPPGRNRWPSPRPRTTGSSSSGSTPRTTCYAAVTGFYSYDHGRTGLESTYNSQLAGTDDSLFVRRLIDLVTNRAPQGATVQTTIEPRVQRAATEALGRRKGAVVALDPTTGAVLAMVTSPTLRPERGRQPRHRSGEQGLQPAGQGPAAAPVEPGRPGDLPARVGVQAGHRRRRARGRA